ncbi:hypothetical protein [Arthrobacter sp. JSM 101049]|uniref:hypothetical protein n=1 Tax=Arthrobacter sp. JSM 101049 TaxID=929097 RepID=UPI00356730FC
MADKVNHRAIVAPATEKLVEANGSQSLIRLRKIQIQTDAGKDVRELEAADNHEDIESKIRAAGFTIDRWEGDTAFLAQAPMSASGKVAMGCIWGAVAAFVLLLGGCVAFMNGASDDEPENYDARVACQTLVKGKLKAPSTAKFSNESESGAGSSWTASGTVEAQNSFGGTVGHTYRCTVHFTDGDDAYTGTATIQQR